MRDFGTALALAAFIEGLLYALFPLGMRRMALQMAAAPAGQLRLAGLGAACLGVAAVWLLRH